MHDPSLEIDFAYDDEQHYAPPIRINWITRGENRPTRDYKWIFIQCCGQIGRKEGDVIISTHPCKSLSDTIKSTEKHHTGQLILKRITHSQVVKHKPALAEWNCCFDENKKRKNIPRWNEAWESRDGKIPFELVDSGCKKGRYVNTGPSEFSVGDSCATTSRDVALRAKPISQRAPKKSASNSSGSSSGDQKEIIESSRLMNPQEVNFTQKNVKKTLSRTEEDPEKYPPLMEAMHRIFDGVLSVERFKRIWVATRDDEDAPDNCFYSCDNRRLFLFKALLLTEIEVDWYKWMDDFKGKTKQNIRMNPEIRMEANDERIEAFREEFIQQRFQRSAEDEEDCQLYIPAECAGYLIGSKGRTIRRQCAIFATEISVSTLSQIHPGKSLGNDILQVAYSEKSKSKRKYVPGRAKKEHVKMVRKLLRKRGLAAEKSQE